MRPVGDRLDALLFSMTHAQVLVSGKDSSLPSGLAFFAMPMPKWLNHITSVLFLHQDSHLLHGQEALMANVEANAPVSHPPVSAAQTFYTPTTADLPVILLREWIERYAGGGVPYSGRSQLPEFDKHGVNVFDTFHSHTKHCTACTGALKNIELGMQARTSTRAPALNLRLL